ncbi:hypothetical protein ACGFXC_33550 [Streptomyces sp. NPDC048507]|uniref:hypothetical protein n=1 Tax=Streptomyces sp. NPDC048507 TaxID=3365560 RepID=UPI003713A4AA
MADYETQVLAAVCSGQVVSYKVTPLYMGSKVVPYAYRMQATGYTQDGSAILFFEKNVPNVIKSVNDGKWHNLGRRAPEGPLR